ncbi:MAG: putative selenium-dependent hydroxylase accessory protein YqeC [Deltaproteobacteria bacterium]|nr:putative selenium-dependent hydroxylase accessory protein YqeC [Deltaproteobacteria bacterium]
MVKDLTSALGLGPREYVALVGGGGKTTLMSALADELRLKGKSLITSTTTKVWNWEVRNWPNVLFDPSDPASHEELKAALKKHGHAFVGRRVLESGKVEGISPGLAGFLYRETDIDYLILEADGAAGRPVKAPADHEPVIPSSATVVVAIMGLEAMGKPLKKEFVFRPEQFSKVTGLNHGERITPGALARIFQSPEGLFKGAPVSAKRIAFLNKLDLVADDQVARDLAALLVRGPQQPVELVVIGSILKGVYFCH